MTVKEHWKWLAREAVESPSEIFKTRLDKDLVQPAPAEPALAGKLD